MKKLFLSGLIFLCCMFTTSCSQEPVDGTRFLFNTICTLTVYSEENPDESAEEIIEGAFDLCEEYENMFSRTIEGSDIDRINNSNGQPVEVSPDTVDIIGEAVRYGEISGGAFDITTAPLSILWDFEGDAPSVPPAGEIEELLKTVDYTKIRVEGSTVTLEPPAKAIDLGAIAKGYITDRLVEYLTDKGVTSAIISLGGNIYAIGTSDGRPFRIGVQDPAGEGGAILGYVEISNKSVVTSGDYQRFFVQDGKVYHHILDPETGYPTDNGLASVTIISDRSTDGDALSTSCFVLGLEDGMELVNGIDGVEAIFVDHDGNMYFSDGFGTGMEFVQA